MVGCIFKGLDGTDIPLKDMVAGDFKDEDQIQVYDLTVGYKTYTYWAADGGWIDDETFELATTPIKPGTAFWLKTPDRSISVTLKGAVASGEYHYVTKAGFQMISPSYPVAFALNDTTKTTWTGLTDGDGIQVRKGNTYTTYTYWVADGGWIDDETFELATEPIAMGSSIWLNTAKTGATLTVAQ